ncbi:hypothetical protein JOC75_000856 [Metabacillus crassostreae]|uniref:hypothetical protein n=1 Tax=Metabacillus crassostreae TaxID=929098 RepID=UPI001958A44B|nr:hypothetical protein [Metabacillus crassostreae]MBM7602886.1 hypothetical protein [Metabacillus crassostreae]
MEWVKSLLDDRDEIKSMKSNMYTGTTKLILGAVLASLACIFQSAGIFVGIGYVLSILATLPIVVASVISLKIGFLTYMLTIFLLAITQPSELLIFPFTTGLLGLSLGIGLKILRNSVLITVFSSFCLTLGITCLLYVIQFPILGPAVTTNFDSKILLYIFAFSILYSWIWLKLSLITLKVVNRFVFRKVAILYSEKG